MCYLCYMGKRFWSQIAVVLLAALLCLYIWLGYWVLVAVAVVAVALLVLWVVRLLRRKQPEDNPVRVAVAPQPKDRERVAVEKRRQQSESVFNTLRQLAVLRPESEREVNRLMEWYTEYLKSNSVYHISPYDYLLQRIKDRQSEAKAAYLKRELAESKGIVRAMMRGLSAERILESIEQNDS